MISNVCGIYIINNNESFFHQLFFPPYSIKHVDIVNCVNLVDVKPTPSRLHPLGSDPYLVMFRGLKGLFRVNPPLESTLTNIKRGVAGTTMFWHTPHVMCCIMARRLYNNSPCNRASSNIRFTCTYKDEEKNG